MVNQKDVAKRAKVSTATVSAVINNNKFVSDDLKKRVIEAIEELHYEPNIIARSLKVKKTNSIGIIIGNIVSQAFSIMAKAAEDIANKYKFNLIVCNSDDDPKKELDYLKVLKSSRVEGIILTSTGKNFEYVKRLIESGTKIVLLDRLIDSINCDAVLLDNEKGAYTAVKYLINRGFRRIGIICGPLDITTGRERLDGYLKALEEAGIKKEDNLINIGTFKKESGIRLTKELLEGLPKPEAIFVSNLDLTLGALETLNVMRVRIPEDISIIGFDNSEWYRIMTPPITVVNHPIYGYGATAAKLLMRRINNEEENIEPIMKRLKTSLLVRRSVK
jgi:DNA-binding LacI/PurR family transcriptional regulator